MQKPIITFLCAFNPFHWALLVFSGVSVTMLLVLLVMGIVWRVASKKKEG